MKKSWLTFLILLSVPLLSTAQKPILWYESPATVWEEALPLGNGRLGAMVFGIPGKERIQLNEDSLWPGGPDDWGLADGTRADLDQIRAYLLSGENTKADSLLVLKFSRKGITRSHQTLGDLWMDFEWHDVADYKRSLNLEDASSVTSFSSEGYEVKQEVIASAPDDALIIRLKTAHPEGFRGKIMLSRPDDEGIPTAESKTLNNNLLEMVGMVTQRGGQIDSEKSPILNGVRFRVLLLAQNLSGEVQAKGSYLEVSGVNELTVKLVAETSFYHADFEEASNKQLEKVEFKSWGELVSSHQREYSGWFGRMSFGLGDEEPDETPTNLRIENVKNGQTDLHLEKVLFDYGRYLLISSSRPGTNPANLQGIWNQHISAPWNADYHLNINFQMNYWPAEVTNLSELHVPMFDFTDGLIENGKKVAKTNFGMRGAMIPHTTDQWQIPFLQAETAYWGSWIGAGAWLGRHYWEHYLYTQDQKFLRERAFPALEQLAWFYSDWLMEDPKDGKLVSAPSTSPENQFITADGQLAASTLGAAMDQQLIVDIFTIYLEAAQLLGEKTELAERITGQLPNLRSGIRLGTDGRILEWDLPYEEHEKGHRHMSHLYAFHPGAAITKAATPETFDAVRKTLEFRLANGGAGTGWSRAWLINFSARLLDGDMAYGHIQKLISQSLYPNLFDAHPPFQIDGNFGLTAGMAEMLIQSHEPGVIRLLPALPPQWKKGKITGLRARGGYTFSLDWDNGELRHFSIQADKTGSVTVVYDGSEMDLELESGESFEIEF